MEIEDSVVYLFSGEHKSKATLPFIAKHQLPLQEVVPIPQEELKNISHSPSLSSLTAYENAKVQFYLEVLGKSEEEAEQRRMEEREQERLRDEERRVMYESLYLSIVQNEKEAAAKSKADKLHRFEEKESETRPPTVNKIYSAKRPPKVQRSLAAELEKKLAQYRRDPMKRAELEDRILKYKLKRMQVTDDQKLINVIEENRKLIKEFTAEARAQNFLKKLQHHHEMMKKVLETKRKIDQENLQRKLQIVNKREIVAEERKRERLMEEARLHRESKQKRWLVIVALASRQHLWITKLHQDRIKRVLYRKQSRAAKIIQRTFRAWRMKVTSRKWRKDMVVVQRQLRKWIIRYRVRRKRRAADRIYNFLTDLQDVNRIVQVIKRFRFQVTQAQHYWRKYKEIQQAQLFVLKLQWDQVEEEVQSQRKMKQLEEQRKQDIMKNALSYTSQYAKKKKATSMYFNTNPVHPKLKEIQEQKVEKTPKKIEVARIPEHIKTRILFENLKMRQKHHAMKIAAWRRILSRQSKEEKEKAALEQARKQIADGIADMRLSNPDLQQVKSESSSRPNSALNSTLSRPGTTSGSHSRPKSSGVRAASREASRKSATTPKSALRAYKSLLFNARDDELNPGVFKILLPRSEMVKLIEQAYKEVEEEKLEPYGQEQKNEEESDEEDVLDHVSELESIINSKTKIEY